MSSGKKHPEDKETEELKAKREGRRAQKSRRIQQTRYINKARAASLQCLLQLSLIQIVTSNLAEDLALGFKTLPVIYF